MNKMTTKENNATGNLHKPPVSGSLPLSEKQITDKMKEGINRLEEMGINMGWKHGTPEYIYGFRDALNWLRGNDR